MQDITLLRPRTDRIVSPRRTILGRVTGGLIAASAIGPAAYAADSGAGSLPIKSIEQIMQASGTMRHGVLTISMDRKDLKSMLPGNVPVTPGVLLNAAYYFQSVGSGKAIMNGNLCLKLEVAGQIRTAG